MPKHVAETEGSNSEEKSSEFDADVYAEVARAADLRDIKLIESKYSVKPEVLEFSSESDKMTHRYYGECSDFSFSQEDGFAIGQYKWTAEVLSGRKKALKLTATFLVSYEGLENADENYVGFYFYKIGRFATFPYFRALFARHVAETGIVMPPLPSLKERVD